MDHTTWWRHQMETFSALLAICAGNSPVSGEFPAQRPVTRSFDFSFDLCPNKRLSKQSWGWWFETPTGALWRHSDGDVWCISYVDRNNTWYRHLQKCFHWRPTFVQLSSQNYCAKPRLNYILDYMICIPQNWYRWSKDTYPEINFYFRLYKRSSG